MRARPLGTVATSAPSACICVAGRAHRAAIVTVPVSTQDRAPRFRSCAREVARARESPPLRLRSAGAALTIETRMTERKREQQADERGEFSVEPASPTRPPRGRTVGRAPQHEILQRALGNRLIAASLRVQARLQIGPVDDPHEREADRIADQVLRDPRPAPLRPAIATMPGVQRHADHGSDCCCGACRVQRHAGHDHDHDHGPGCSCPACGGVQRKAEGAHAPGCACSGCAAVQRKPAADGSFAAGPELAARIQRLSAGGSPLPEHVRTDMEQRFGADFGDVRVHHDAEAAALSRDLRAHAFTRGQHIAFAPGKFDPGSAAGRWLLAHELTHTIQQTGGVRRKADAPDIRARPDGDLVVQRHSTHEHYLLGTMKPDELASLPFLRAEVLKPKPKKEIKKGLLEEESDYQDADLALKIENALHIIEQEIDRLIAFQKKDPEKQLEEQKDDKVGKVVEVDEEYQVPVVKIPTKDGTSVICTYGELNTLADMYGTIADMSRADAKTIVGMLQGVRQRSYLALFQIYKELGGAKRELQVHLGRPGTSFAGAIGFSGKEKPVLGALMAVREYEAKTRSEESLFDEENATAALARNACHFAPETWDTWRRYHTKARELALSSYRKGEEASAEDLLGLVTPEARRKLQAEQRELANAAVLHAGFGDHYLQDAFAAGHLIDKTKVMAWYFEWQKKQGKLKETPGYAMIDALLEYSLESNPQMMENVQGGVSAKLEEIGVSEVKDHILILMWWRHEALEQRDKKADKYNYITASTLAKSKTPVQLDGAGAVKVLNRLVELGFVKLHKAAYKTDTYELLDEHIYPIDPKRTPDTVRLGLFESRSAFRSLDDHRAPKKDSDTTYHSSAHDPDSPDFLAEAKEFYYTAYGKFLDKAHLQLITNYLHNIFCAQGLEVETESGTEIGRIYGDVAMLTPGAHDGVLFSAETSARARQAIFDTLATGKAKHSAADIEARFPRKVAADWSGKGGVKPIKIDNWWAALKEECFKEEGLFARGSKGIKAWGAKFVKKKLSPNEHMVTPYDKLVDDDEFAPEVEDVDIFDIGPPKHDPIF